jgi:hypothetical protein
MAGDDLAGSELVEEAFLLAAGEATGGQGAAGRVATRRIAHPHPDSGEALCRLLEQVRTPYLLAVDPGAGLELAPHAVERLLAAAEATDAPLVYGDSLDRLDQGLRPHPVADYQEGSLREGFDFGPLELWSVAAMRRACERHGAPAADLRHHAWYDLRLKASLAAPPFHLPEPLAARRPPERRASGRAVFDYLTVRREAQVEAERVATAHLDRLGARVAPPFRPFEAGGDWPVEASVVIPVRNRAGTIADAVASALGQECDFAHNVLVVDNHSTDGTAAVLADLAAREPRLLWLRPESRALGIGGCWNEAIFHPACGRYAVQLDSDDLYADGSALATMVAALAGGRCGLAIGSYTTVDSSLAEIPPGLVDHREWSDDNGPNNALRIEGLGAPRAFATELVRRHPFPNASYGEDYAVALRLSRDWRVGRVYRSVYLCRRWEGNTDADLTPETLARHHAYKDRLRTLEIAARRRRNRAGGDGGER